MKKSTKTSISKLKNELKNKTILVTGGAGSIGSSLVKKLLEFDVRSVRVLDIDEHALFKLNRKLNDKRIRLLLGSILNPDRVDMAITGVDIIFHMAAIKNIEISEFNPIETIDTNINGTVNLIKSSIKNNPKKFLNISTDKAAEPSTLYGTTKQLSERLTSWAGTHITQTKFASIRFGNVFETRGNVFEIWEEQSKNGDALTITDPKMNRYFFHVEEAIDFILESLILMKKGEIFVPKLKKYNIGNLAKKYSKKYNVIGLRRGEKMNEILLSESEKKRSVTKNNMWIISPY